ncbi:hypothetical protein [Haloarchaeobius sp. TZWWS8]|uniref:hypothetical protein n=1 Tax=Haloarchaeobius sp. TZWWS8 TaxID=3446121 RepID=UPI003EBEA2C4
MDRVAPDEAFEYGLSLVERVAAVVFVGGVPTFFGAVLFVRDIAPVLGFILIVVGAVISLSGLVGLTYKVVADGVARGLQEAAAAEAADKSVEVRAVTRTARDESGPERKAGTEPDDEE